jgi:Ca-activated chloride channel homolog
MALDPGDWFAVPSALPVLLLAPLWWFALWLLDRGRAHKLQQLCGRRADVLGDVDPVRRHRRRIFASAALFCGLLAVAQPAWGEGTQPSAQRLVDVVLCLDVSRSMLARDLQPSRLEFARRELHALCERARGDRLGLVVFAGEAVLFAPLTQDLDGLAQLVDLASPLSVQRGGTDLGACLEQALAVLAGGTGEHEVVVLLSDGEDLSRKALTAAEQCRQRGIAVHCVGLGSAAGAKIPLPGPGQGETFLRSPDGSDVVSAMDPTTMRRIASLTGGVYVDAQSRARPLVALYEQHILPMARKALASAGGEASRTNRFQWPLLAGFVLWMLHLCSTDRRRR